MLRTQEKTQVIPTSENTRILYICDLNLTHGGAQKITFKTLECLSKDFNLYIYSPDEPSQESLELLNDLHLYSVFDAEFNIEKIIEIINKFNIEYMLIQWENPTWVSSSYLIKRKLNVKVILMIHNLPYIDSPVNNIIKNWFILTLLRILKLGASLFFGSIGKNNVLQDGGESYEKSFTVKEFLKKGKDTPLKIYLTYKGIKYADGIICMGPASAYYLNKYLNINKSMYVVKHNAAVDVKNKIINKIYKYDFVFMAAYLQVEKGIIDLLDIFYYVKNNFSNDPNIIIIGRFFDSKTQNDFYKKVDRLNLRKNVIMAGFVTEEEKIEILSSSRIFLYPSRKDNFSISLAEALSYGCPSVVFDLPFSWQFNSTAVFRIPYKKLDKMATTSLALLKISYDKPDEFEKLCESALNDILNQFTWKKTCEDQINAIKTLEDFE